MTSYLRWNPVSCLRAAAAALFVLLFSSLTVSAQSGAKKDFAIEAGDAASTLKQFAQQSGAELLYSADVVEGVRTHAVKGEFTPKDALEIMVADTALVVSQGRTTGGLAIRRATEAEAKNVERAIVESSGRPDRSGRTELDEKGEPVVKLDTFEVFGRKTLNMDIPRTRNDAQPYVVFTGQEIEHSQASDIESFLMSHLPMNTANATINQQGAAQPTFSFGTINLRGLGINQTLILVDGRRLPPTASFTNNGDFLQPSINGIPMASIDRIEVLPATAGGIYGGSATGGVINIIRKRNYRGLELQTSYGETFRSDTETMKLYLSGGLNLLKDRLNVTFGYGYSHQRPLTVSDRSFAQEATALALANNPAFQGITTPPLGAMPNIASATVVFSSRFNRYLAIPNGVTLILDSGQSLGSSITSVPRGYDGPAFDGGAALVKRAGMYDLSPAETGTALVRAPTTHSGFLSFRHDLTEVINGYLDLSMTRDVSDLSTIGQRPISTPILADDPNNPFQQSILALWASPAQRLPGQAKLSSEQVIAGLIIRPSKTWSVALERNWSRTETRSVETRDGSLSAAGLLFAAPYALKDPTISQLDLSPYIASTPDTYGGPFRTTLKSDSIRFSGSSFILPAGPLQLNGLVERRGVHTADAFMETTISGAYYVTMFPYRERKEQSYYLEAHFPLIEAARQSAVPKKLDLIASIRHDDYQTVSTITQPTASTRAGPFVDPIYARNEVGSTSYTFAARLELGGGVMLRTSYGTGFLPPSLAKFQKNQSVRLTAIPNPSDPRRGNTPLSLPRTEYFGGNPELLSEDSASWTQGIAFTPSIVKGLRVSVDYVDIHKTNEAYDPTVTEILGYESQFPGRVIRGEKLAADPSDWAGPVTAIDASAINLSGTISRSINIQGDYEWSSNFGSFHGALVATRMLGLQRRLTPSSNPYDLVGYTDGPLKWRGQGSLNWSHGNWAAGWSAQYLGSYLITYGNPTLTFLNATRVLNQGSERIASQTYHDVYLSYTFPKRGWFLNSARVMVGVQNVFDASPPIIASFAGSDPNVYSTYGDPRMRRYTLNIKKSF